MMKASKKLDLTKKHKKIDKNLYSNDRGYLLNDFMLYFQDRRVEDRYLFEHIEKFKLFFNSLAILHLIVNIIFLINVLLSYSS